MLYANPIFSKILQTLVEVHMDQATVALVIPEGNKWEEKEKLWGPLLEKLMVTKLLLPDIPLYRLNPKEEVLPKPCWRTAMYLVSGKNVSSNPMENVSEEIKKFVLKQHRGYGKEEMMKRFPNVDESKEEHKFGTPKFQVEEVVRESPKDARQTQEESEETSDESGSISEAPSESTVPFSNDSYTTMDYNDLVANLFLEEVEPLEAPSTPSETPNPKKLLSHVSLPLESMTSEGDKPELCQLHTRPSKNSFPSSNKDLEETRLLLLNQIDRLQKLEFKEKRKSMVYVDEYHGEDWTQLDVGEELVMLHELQGGPNPEEYHITWNGPAPHPPASPILPDVFATVSAELQEAEAPQQLDDEMPQAPSPPTRQEKPRTEPLTHPITTMELPPQQRTTPHRNGFRDLPREWAVHNGTIRRDEITPGLQAIRLHSITEPTTT